MDVKDKLAVAQRFCHKLGIVLAEVAYIGDDINDILLMKEVSLSASPTNAPDYIKNNKMDMVIDRCLNDVKI